MFSKFYLTQDVRTLLGWDVSCKYRLDETTRRVTKHAYFSPAGYAGLLHIFVKWLLYSESNREFTWDGDVCKEDRAGLRHR
jgi:hypothetical protein